MANDRRGMIEGEWRTANGEWIAILKSQNPNRGMIDGGVHLKIHITII